MDTVVKKCRLLNTDKDCKKIIEVFLKEVEGNICEPLVDKYVIEEFLHIANESGLIRAWYDKDESLVGVLLFTVDNTWWTLEPIVMEMLVMCTDKRYAGFQRLAMTELERIARAYESRLITSGNLLSNKPKVVANGYIHKGGYQGQYQIFLKRLKGEQDYNE